MSNKRKTRSIITLPVFNDHREVNDYRENSETNSFDYFLGEDVINSVPLPKSFGESIIRNSEEIHVTQNPNTQIHSYSTSGSDLEGILDLSAKLSGISSSSSLSWSEDYELEITKKVQHELEKLDRALQGLEEVPPPHDKDEIAEWKYFFPYLCILDQKTPTNSMENSEASSESEDETFRPVYLKKCNTSKLTSSNLLQNRSSRVNKKTEEQAQNFLNVNSNYHKPPYKPRSLDIEKYLKISSLENADSGRRKQSSQSVVIRQKSKERSADLSPGYTSLPFITATPLKNRTQKPVKKNNPSKFLTLPPITNSFRSMSATPRQASSKSMFVSLNFEKDSSARGAQMRLKSDLMKLLEHIPVTNR